MSIHSLTPRWVTAFIILSLSVVPLSAASVFGHTADSLLRVLDKELTLSGVYEQQKRARLDRLWNKKRSAVDDRQKFENIYQLFREYKNYNMDTTVLLAREALAIARNLSVDSLIWEAQLMEVEGLKGMGNYQESLVVLQSIPTRARDNNKYRYYNRFISIYLSLYESTRPLPEAEEYRRKLLLYRDSVANVEPGSWGEILNKAETLKLTGQPEKALDLYEAYLRDTTKYEVNNPAVMWHVLGDTYAMVGQADKAVEFLARSSIADMRNNIRNYMSLQELASILNEHGDTERAFNYMLRTLSDIDLCHARSRVYEVADIMPVINDAYVMQARRNSRSQTMVIILVSLVALIMVGLLLVIRNRNIRLRRQHAFLDATNAKLIKGQEELAALNSNLAELNERLRESNSIKEKYIGYLFSLCSNYIEQTDKYRKSVSQQLKVRNVTEAEKLLSKAPKELSMRSFLREFDAIFLSLFPNFVEHFNELLEPEARVTPPEGELLTTELRIYALVRLGISDSTKIALFLNYSIQTVYNYRQRMRNNACIPKNEFVTAVKNIKP